MKKLATALAALAFLGGSLISAAPAQAATGYVYVVINNRVCGGLGSGLTVRGIVGNIDKTSWFIRQYDQGDNIVYPRVQLGVRNTGTFTVQCYKKPAWYLPHVNVGLAHIAQSFTPTQHGQTIWIG